MTYTEEDVWAAMQTRQINSWLGNAKAGHLGREAQNNATVRQAIADTYNDMGEHLTAQALEQEIAKYDRGKVVLAQYKIVDHEFVENSEQAESWFVEHYKINGPVVWRNAGYVATSPRYLAVALKPR